jgi:hypothetical protein
LLERLAHRQSLLQTRSHTVLEAKEAAHRAAANLCALQRQEQALREEETSARELLAREVELLRSAIA